MGRIHDAVTGYFASRDWERAVDDAAGLTSFPAGGRNGNWTMYANAREDAHQLVLHSVHPEAVPADHRVDTALFLTRVNFGMVIGNFEIDLDDGELRFKTSIDVEGAELTEPLIDQLVLANLAMMDRYLPGIRAVSAGAGVEAALAAVG